MGIPRKTLIMLPHLDDEFALVPLIKKIAKYGPEDLKIVYCAERILDSRKKIKKRRLESIASLELLGCQKENIIYLNDKFIVGDLKLRAASKNIYNFVEEFHLKEKFSCIITLNFEGGHPDHDSLALIVDKFTKAHDIKPIYVPSYNYRKTLFVPLSVFRPLVCQRNYFTSESYDLFCWVDCLKIAWIYRTERKAFIKLLPFIIFQSIFSKKIYQSNILNINSVNWGKSISNKRYRTSKKEILEAIKW